MSGGRNVKASASVNPVSNQDSEDNYTEDFEENSVMPSNSRVGASERHSKMEQSKMETTAKPSAELLKESPAFHVITTETEGHGIDSPFLSNSKNLVKYNLSDELIQAMINVIEETKIRMKHDRKLKS